MHHTAPPGKRMPPETAEAGWAALGLPTDDMAARKRDALYTLMRWGALRAALRAGIISDAMLSRALDGALGGTAHTWE